MIYIVYFSMAVHNLNIILLLFLVMNFIILLRVIIFYCNCSLLKSKFGDGEHGDRREEKRRMARILPR